MTGIEGAKREYSQFMFECKTYTFTYVVTYMLKVVFCWVADNKDIIGGRGWIQNMVLDLESVKNFGYVLSGSHFIYCL